MAINRRLFNRYMLALATTGISTPYAIANKPLPLWFMPDETHPHQCTWMCFIANSSIWPKQQIASLEQDLLQIATTIARYEPVNMLVRPTDYQRLKQRLNKTTHYPTTLYQTMMDDLWIRDTGPVFVVDDAGNKAAIDFNFNGWGEKQRYSYDQHIAAFISQQAGVNRIQSSLILEGGCFEVNGSGTAIMTQSCIINDNRNPGLNKKEIENTLKQHLGLKKIIWLRGIKAMDITDAHTDLYARFVNQNTVVVARENHPELYDYALTRENIRILQAATNAQGEKLQLVIIDNPQTIDTQHDTDSFAAGYLGYYLCNNALVMQKFGDRTVDKKAKDQLQALFPTRRIHQINTNTLASGGGSIHCATQQEPKLSIS